MIRTRLVALARRVQTWNRVRSPWGRAHTTALSTLAAARDAAQRVANLHADVRHALDVLGKVRARLDTVHARLDAIDSRLEALELYAVDSRLGDDWVVITGDSPLVTWLRSDPERSAQLDEWIAVTGTAEAPAIAVHRRTSEVQAATLGGWHGPLAWSWHPIAAPWDQFPVEVPVQPPPYAPAA